MFFWSNICIESDRKMPPVGMSEFSTDEDDHDADVMLCLIYNILWSPSIDRRPSALNHSRDPIYTEPILKLVCLFLFPSSWTSRVIIIICSVDHLFVVSTTLSVCHAIQLINYTEPNKRGDPIIEHVGTLFLVHKFRAFSLSVSSRNSRCSWTIKLVKHWSNT